MRQLFHTYLLECRESEARMKETPTEAVSYCLLLTLLAGPSNTPLNLLGIGERQCNVRLLLVIDMISANDDLAFFVAASRTVLQSTGASFFWWRLPRRGRNVRRRLALCIPILPTQVIGSLLLKSESSLQRTGVY